MVGANNIIIEPHGVNALNLATRLSSIEQCDSISLNPLSCTKKSLPITHPAHFLYKNVHPPRRRSVRLPKPHLRLKLVRNSRRLPPQHSLPIDPNPTLRLSIPTTRLRPPTCRRHQIQPGLPRRVCSHV